MNRKNRQIAYLIIIVLTILMAAYVAFAVFFKRILITEPGSMGSRLVDIPWKK